MDQYLISSIVSINNSTVNRREGGGGEFKRLQTRASKPTYLGSILNHTEGCFACGIYVQETCLKSLHNVFFRDT